MMSFLLSPLPARTASVFSSIRSLANLLMTFRVRRKRMWSLVGVYCTNFKIGMGIRYQKERKSRVSFDGYGMASALQVRKLINPVSEIQVRKGTYNMFLYASMTGFRASSSAPHCTSNPTASDPSI